MPKFNIYIYIYISVSSFTYLQLRSFILYIYIYIYIYIYLKMYISEPMRLSLRRWLTPTWEDIYIYIYIYICIYIYIFKKCISISGPVRLSLHGRLTLTWEDVALEVTVFFVGVKCTSKTHLVKYSLIYYDWLIWHRSCVLWLGGRVSVLHSEVAGSVSSGGDHGIRCWWNLIRSKQFFSVPYVTLVAFRIFQSW